MKATEAEGSSKGDPCAAEAGAVALELDATGDGSFKRAEPVADGSWLRGVWLLCTSTSQPTYLALPFGIAALGWPGGMVVLAVTALASPYCGLLLAKMFQFGGKRNVTYRGLAKAVMAKHRFAYHIVAIPQFVNIVGVGVVNLIVAGSCLQSIYELFCTNPDTCTVRNCVWQLVAGAALLLVAQLPSISHLAPVTMVTTFFLLFYSCTAVVLSVMQGGGRGADYSIPGNTINQVMNGFNAIGIVVFAFTNIIFPEVQATLRPDASGSAYRPMRKAILGAYAIINTVQLVVSTVGYWAYGNTVSSFLLTEFTHPKWLLTLVNLMCVIQLLVGEQVFECVLYDSWEQKLMRRFARATWLRSSRTDPDGRRVAVPSRWCMLLLRVPYVVIITFLAAAFPFISSIMGFVGAVGLTPLVFIYPPYMYLLARGQEGLSAASRWAHAALAIVFACAGTLAAIGAVRSIVLSIQQHDFFT